MDKLIVLLMLALFGVAHLVYRLYGRKKPPGKFYDHYWPD